MSISSHNRRLGCLILVVSRSAMAELPPILISGARTSAPGLDIPAATTTITREEIAETGARDLDEVLRQIPALHVSDGLGNGGNSRIDMRGFGATAASNVAVLVNGRKINPATDSATLYLNSIDLDEVEHVEGLRVVHAVVEHLAVDRTGGPSCGRAGLGEHVVQEDVGLRVDV